MTDPIADMLTRIRNASLVKKDKVVIPFSKLKFEIAKVLLAHNYIASINKKGRKVKKFLELGLSYENSAPRIQGLRRISRPGQRAYAKSTDLKSVKSGFGIAVISTPKGILTDKEARKSKVGGEILCEVW